MKDLLKGLALLATGFGLGFVCAELKSGRTFEWESEDGAVKFSINPNSTLTDQIDDTIENISDEIEDAIDSLDINKK